MASSGSQQNVELVREAWAAFLAGDIEGALANAHPDAVAFRAPPLPDSKTYHGPEGVLQMYVDWTTEFAEFEMKAEQFIDAGDRVVVEVLQRGRGRASGAVVEGRFWFVHTIADGMIKRQDVFDTRAQAFEAAGLRE
jgi:ketosteroid isomerase-like protein